MAYFHMLSFVAAALVQYTSAFDLPSFSLAATTSSEAQQTNIIVSELDAGKKWWFRVGDLLYHMPEENTDINNYYCAMGSQSALTEELRLSRVGGHGRWHIFYFPTAEPPKVDVAAGVGRADRRSSLSKFIRVQHGIVLSDEFPIYEVQDYKSPLSEEAQKIEEEAVAKVTSEEVLAYLTELTSLKSRSFALGDATEASVSLLEGWFTSLGMNTCRHSFTSMGFDLANVVAFVQGETDDVVVVGAHYDSRPFDGNAPGAEDNGSGIAVMLAMMKAFMDANATTKKSIYFVAFGGEEGGLFGSEAFAGSIDPANETAMDLPDECKVQVGTNEGSSSSFLRSFLQGSRSTTRTTMKVDAIIMDEVGWVSPNMDEQTVNLESYDTASDIMDHLASASHDHNGDGLKVVHSNNPFGSDHMPFLDRGMQAVLTINGDDEGYPDYHKDSDVIGNVDPEYAAKIGKMNLGALLRMVGLQEFSNSSLVQKATSSLRGTGIAVHVVE